MDEDELDQQAVRDLIVLISIEIVRARREDREPDIEADIQRYIDMLAGPNEAVDGLFGVFVPIIDNIVELAGQDTEVILQNYLVPPDD